MRRYYALSTVLVNNKNEAIGECHLKGAAVQSKPCVGVITQRRNLRGNWGGNAETQRSGAATEAGQYHPLPLSPPPPRIPPAEKRKRRRRRRRKMRVCKRNLAQIASFSKIALRRNAAKRGGAKSCRAKSYQE